MRQDRLEVNLWHADYTKKFKERKVGETKYFVAECAKIYVVEARVKKSNSDDPLDNYLTIVFKIDGTQVYSQVLYPNSFNQFWDTDRKTFCAIVKVAGYTTGYNTFQFKFQPTEQQVTGNDLNSLHLGLIEVSLYKGILPETPQPDQVKGVGSSSGDKKFWLQPSAFTAFVAQPNYAYVTYNTNGPPALLMRCPYHTKGILTLIANENKHPGQRAPIAAPAPIVAPVVAAPAPVPVKAPPARPQRAVTVKPQPANDYLDDFDDDFIDSGSENDDDDEDYEDYEEEEEAVVPPPPLPAPQPAVTATAPTVPISKPVKPAKVPKPRKEKPIKVKPVKVKPVKEAKPAKTEKPTAVKPEVKAEVKAEVKGEVKRERSEFNLCDISNSPSKRCKTEPCTIDLNTPSPAPKDILKQRWAAKKSYEI